ncbi:MAG: hypothetical protein ACE149_00080 [Armatimonadota bacterium]
MAEIDCEFPGGNILLDSTEGDTVRVRQDQRDTFQYQWFYWYLRVRGAASRRLRFEFSDPVVGVRGPGVSLDGGWTWRWLGAEAGDERSFSYAFPEIAGEVRFSVGMPYTQQNWERLVESAGRSGHALRTDTLCRSRKGREVEWVEFGSIEREPPHRVLLTARHHCCEMMASYALEGIIEAALADDETGGWLRENVAFGAAPFMDKDGVEDGDQGKGRDPHDHNRDYAAPCIYPEVEALRARAREWSEGGLRFFLDLHCPGLRGRHHEEIYFVGSPEAAVWEQAEQFAATLERVARGPLPYRRQDNLPFGADWNTEAVPAPSGEYRDASDWIAALPGVSFGVTIELPYANALGAEVNGESARAFGRDLAVAVRHHLADSG